MSIIKSNQGQVSGLDVVGHEIEFIASRQVPDSASEVVIINGIDLRRFHRNPVLLFQHDHNKIIGTVTSLTQTIVDDEHALIGRAKFSMQDEESRQAFTRVKEGLLRGVSIAFRVNKVGPPEFSGQTGRTFLESELTEISLVAVPACADCTILETKTGQPSHAIEVTPALVKQTIQDTVAEVMGSFIRQSIEASITREIRRHQGLVD